MTMDIKEASRADTGTLAAIVKKANEPVARALGLNRDNAPTHPSFCTPDWILTGMDRGETYFILEKDRVPLGCAACELPEKGLAYLNRLAVLPRFQNQGMGKALVDHVISHAGARKAERISIGIIAQHTELKDWYERLGFRVHEKKTIPHLVFDVLLMEYAIP